MPIRTPSSSGAPRRQAGVTLIELMVGLLIGLLAVLVISQVLLVVEGQKRSTTSGADAQLTGSLAMYTLQRELEMAGYGISTNRAGLGCAIRSKRFTAGNGGVTRPLAPVVITNGGAAGQPDTVRFFSSGKASFSVPTLVTNDHPLVGPPSEEFAVNNTVGVIATAGAVPGDLLVAVPPAPDSTNTCVIFRANGAGTVVGTTIRHNSGAGDPGGWNGVNLADLLTFFPAAGFPAGSYVVNLGPGLIDRSYAVAAGTLRMTEFNNVDATLTTTDLFPQVVNLQAFYGKDTSATPDGAVDVYDTVTPTTPAGWAQVIVVRVALVVRSNQFEREAVTTAAPVWDLGATPTVTGSDTCGSSQCLTLPVNTDITNTEWQNYRYKVYDTVIPLRNLLWRS
jgi:type IV pilus assembly protein PilW